ncbi:membrane protein insertase YidC [Actinotalea sp. Marseille-Q4924]|uniref:membrane protein insertase YidC n=1 Tax=Actinotalea sp. Marseille-Q4924 TaxID=2866571 RepID=UPI001CE3F5F8|nr:membrane protein insertase YidC [Actinotalea sp. Marseille-Q4924]
MSIDSIFYPLKWVVAWIMYGFHELLTGLGLPSESGAAWVGSIVGLVVVIRILLIPLFVKQIKASRGMQLVAPELQKVQKKYKGKTDPASREAMTRETMELYKKHGTNPFASCLPILAQSPIFFALFRVLYTLPNVANGTYQNGARDSIGPIDQQLAQEAESATIFGARISETFLGSDDIKVKIVTVLLIVAMSATTFFTQRQLTQKNMPASALQGPMAQQQKMLLYLLPLIFAISGVNFPIGVLVYWTTTNLWSMGQQFYVIRNNPTPGSEAERMLKERRARKAARHGEVLETETPAVVDTKPKGQRQQPKRKDRAKTTGRPAPAAGGADDDTTSSVAGEAGTPDVGGDGVRRPPASGTSAPSGPSGPSANGATSAGKSGKKKPRATGPGAPR